MKNCLKCGIQHDKNGKFCSRSCANSRCWSEEDKIKKSDAAKKFYSTDSGSKRKKEISKFQSQMTMSAETKLKISSSVKDSWTEEMRVSAAKRASRRVISKETRDKMRQIAIDRSFGGHTSKRKLYFKKTNGTIVYLQSSYEIKFAEILEKLNIDWTRPDPLTWYDDNGKMHRYYPDFKVNGVYIDTKNDYLAIKDLPKIQAVCDQNLVNVRIFTYSMINEAEIIALLAQR